METIVENTKTSRWEKFYASLKAVIQRIIQSVIVTGILLALWGFFRPLLTKANPESFNEYWVEFLRIWHLDYLNYAGTMLVVIITAAILQTLFEIKELGMDRWDRTKSGFLFTIFMIVGIVSLVATPLAVTYSSFFKLFAGTGATVLEISNVITIVVICLAGLITLISNKHGILYGILVTASAAFITGFVQDLYVFGTLFLLPVIAAIALKLIVMKIIVPGWKFVFNTKW